MPVEADPREAAHGAVPGLAADPYIGVVLDGEFTISDKLGEGGMGAVYRAVQNVTDRTVAVKVLHRHLYDENTSRRFLQEAKIVAKLSHPNIVTVYKYGAHADGTLFIAMEFVNGFPLSELLVENNEFDVDRALPLMIQLAEALAYAHDQKIVHRDIKPDNMVLTRASRREQVKLLDFGIAKAMDGNASLTRTGALFGSPPYMSPEQWRQTRDIDGRTDIYSLGCAFYQMLTGRLPHVADSVVGFMRAHTTLRPTPPKDVSRTISALPVLNDIILKCMEIEREDRYPDAYALLEALKEAQVDFEAARRGRALPEGGGAAAGIAPAGLLGPGDRIGSSSVTDAVGLGPTHVALAQAILADSPAEAPDPPQPPAEPAPRPFASERPPARLAPSTPPPSPRGASDVAAGRPAIGGRNRTHVALVTLGAILWVALATAVFFVR